MNIITLFCEIDDFFLAYEKLGTVNTVSYPVRRHPLKHAGDRDGCIQVR